MLSRCFLAIVAAVALATSLHAEEPNYTRTEDVIYARKYGVALTMDVFTPKIGRAHV